MIFVEVVYEGKTKIVLKSNDEWFLEFKDSVTGDDSGNIDSGGNRVVDELEGKAEATAKTATHFFRMINEEDVSTHFVELSSPTRIQIIPTERIPLEVIYRKSAYGSFLSRYGDYVDPMEELNLIEFNLKDDELGDPLLTEESVIRLKIASTEDIQQMKRITREVANLIQSDLGEHGLDLIDMKLEFGRSDGGLRVVDEISGDTMRVRDLETGQMLNQIELAERLELT